MCFLPTADADSSDLVLIRHGATVANAAQPYRLQGRNSDLPLCAAGRQQADAVSRFLSDCSISRVLSSPLRRALETAARVAEPHQLRVETWDDVIECDVGRWEGATWEQIERDEPAAYRAFLADPATAGYPEGESYAEVQGRVVPAFERLLEQSAGSAVAVVSHNVVNRTYLAWLLDLPASKARRIPQHNGGISLIRRRHGETKLITLNSVGHLNLV